MNNTKDINNNTESIYPWAQQSFMNSAQDMMNSVVNDSDDDFNIIETNPPHDISTPPSQREGDKGSLYLDPEVSPWLPQYPFEEGTPMNTYCGLQQDATFNNETNDKTNDETNDETNGETNDEVQPDLKYKNCMDEWSKKEKERYENTPRTRKILFNEDDYRIDPYDYNWYTRRDFYEFYGSDEVWKQQVPHKCLLRDHLHQIVENYSYLDYKILNVFMENIADTYR